MIVDNAIPDVNCYFCYFLGDDNRPPIILKSADIYTAPDCGKHSGTFAYRKYLQTYRRK